MTNTKVLIVDDTPANLALLEEILDEQDYEIMTAISGENALRLLKDEEPDIILLDIMMPGMDGYQTCQEIKAIERLKSIPIIFLSAKGETIDKIRGFDLGAVDYLTKPFQIEELLVRVKNHLKNYFSKKSLIEAQILLDQSHKISKLGTFSLNIDERVMTLDKECQKLLKLDSQYISMEDFCLLFYETHAQKLTKLFNEIIDFGISFSQELDLEIENHLKSFSIHAEAYSKEEKLSHIYGALQDITEMVAQRNTMKKYVEIVDQNILTAQTDLNGIIIYVSDAFCKLSGYRKEELMGVNHNIVRHSDTSDSLFKGMWKSIQSGKIWKGEHKNQKKNGDTYWVNTTITPDFDYKGNITSYTGIGTDITNEKKILELSITDQMTKLFNRRHFNNTLPTEIKRSIRNKQKLAFIMLDVDHFKQYNDIYGHQEGDTVLKSLSKTLKKVMKRIEDSVFRLGGEEFGILCNVTDKEALEKLLKELLLKIENLHIEHKGNSASQYVTSSFGSILIDFNDKKNYDMKPDTIYKLCDDELYKAKEEGRNTFKIHSC